MAFFMSPFLRLVNVTCLRGGVGGGWFGEYETIDARDARDCALVNFLRKELEAFLKKTTPPEKLPTTSASCRMVSFDPRRVESRGAETIRTNRRG